jgi:hypothetical protein
MKKIFKVFEKMPNLESFKDFKIICTHSDTFHCDEALACALLSFTKEFSNSKFYSKIRYNYQVNN